LLLLDAGKSLFKGSNNNNRHPQLVKGMGIAKAYMKMGYDAVALSSSDVMAGQLFLEQTFQEGLPWVSANLVDKNGVLVAQSHLIKTVDSIKIGIIGLTDELAVHEEYSTIDYQTALENVLQPIDGQCDMIILLSNFTGGVNKEIAAKFPSIDLILSSDRSLGKMRPLVVNNTLITQTSTRGKYLGTLDIEWHGRGIWYNDRQISLSELRTREKTVSTQLDQLKANKSEQTGKNKKKIARLQIKKQRLEKEIEVRDLQEAKFSGQPNKHRLRFIPVQPKKSPEDIESIVQEIKRGLKN
jgi:2',3'-cyclic-nucleotide 2'-phosphodiesterase (5'-nucleotidase family)